MSSQLCTCLVGTDFLNLFLFSGLRNIENDSREQAGFLSGPDCQKHLKFEENWWTDFQISNELHKKFYHQKNSH